MHKLLENATKELKQIEDVGLNASNLDNAFKLASIAKDVHKIKKYEREEEESNMRYPNYERGRYDGDYRPHRYREDEWDGYFGDRPMHDDYARRTSSSGRMRYRSDDRINDHLDRIMDSADMYIYGRERYRDSGNSERVVEGLEKLMHSVCIFVESMMDFAETPEEKEVIRKHIQKMKSM